MELCTEPIGSGDVCSSLREGLTITAPVVVSRGFSEVIRGGTSVSIGVKHLFQVIDPLEEEH